jgi:hypothetical protein
MLDDARIESSIFGHLLGSLLCTFEVGELANYLGRTLFIADALWKTRICYPGFGTVCTALIGYYGYIRKVY